MRRLKLIVAYDGGPFSGWQSQRDGNAVQDHLEKAFLRVTRTPVRVHGAGRTDAGVHALAQCAHVDVEKSLPTERWTAALNASLPPTIRVLRTRYVSPKFHARFSARGKIYRYRIWNDKVLWPLERGRVWHIPAKLDLALLQSAAKYLVGRHNFAAFAANRGQPAKSTVRTVSSIKVTRRGSVITLEIGADGFLYKMARLIVGALVDCAAGKTDPEEFKKRLSGSVLSRRIAAPAAGLFLVRVRY